MAEDFPDVSNKLAAPTKKSLFERQKAEAEAKRQREQEETAAVYEDFVKSFDDDGEAAPNPNNAPFRAGMGRGAGSGGGGGGGGFSKRHFGAPSGPSGRGGFGNKANSGPGSLGPPPPSLSRKRPYDGSEPRQREGIFAFEDAVSGPTDAKTLLQHSDDEDVHEEARSQERAVPKPTMRLSSLPPGISPAAIKAIIPSTLTVEGVRILPPSGPGTKTTDRRSVTAIVTLAKDTPALDIDTAVSALQNRYMGRGYYLSLSRHLSSASIGLDTPSSFSLPSSGSALPFGARPIAPPVSMGRAPPSSLHRGGFAPPVSYNSPQNYNRAPAVQVTVKPPTDLRTLKLIHKTVEMLLHHGPEFEALLMTRKQVQNEERWAWIWDARSTGGVYYRWRLWELLTNLNARRKSRNLSASSTPQQIFTNSAQWVPPEQKLQFEYTTRLDQFVSDSDYDSTEDEDSGDEGRRRYAQHHGGAPPPDQPNLEADMPAYLNPLNKAKLTYLLARLPTSISRLRRGDVIRVTAFAIQHAGEGADEVVEMIVDNVTNPLAFTSANPDYQASNLSTNRRDSSAPKDHSDSATPNANFNDDPLEDLDTTPAKLVALYIISDILSTSSTSGVRHAWRYRQLFEARLKKCHTFAALGRLEKTQSWGRLRAEKWKRSVHSVFSLWESWCVFPAEAHEGFVAEFNEPPPTRQEKEKKEQEEKEERERLAGMVTGKVKTGWKAVDPQDEEPNHGPAKEIDDMDIDEEAHEQEDDDYNDNDEEVDDDEDDDGITSDASDRSSTPENIDDGIPMSDSSSSSSEDEEEDIPSNLEGVPIPTGFSLAGTPLSHRTPPPSSRSNEPAPFPPTVAPDRRAALLAANAARLSQTTITAVPLVQARAAPPDADAPSGVVRRRQRPRAEDMFASDGE